MKLPLLLLQLLLLLSCLAITTTSTTVITTCTPNLDTIYDSTDAASTGITQLGINLLQEFGGEKNMLVSPYSIWSVFAVLLVGAERNTEQEIGQVLGLNGKEGVLSLLRKLEDSLEKAASSDGNVTLDIANRVYLQAGFSIKKCQSELSHLLVSLDMTQRTAAANTINDFVNTATQGLIPRIISANMLGPATRMVALNAIYFKGFWTNPFNKALTEPRPFYVSPTSGAVSVDTMFQVSMPVMFGHSQTLGAQVIQLKYSSGLFSMSILLPSEEGDAAFNATINALTPTALRQALTQVEQGNYDFYMPKFEIKSTFQEELKMVLQKLGINDLFTSAADLSSFGENLYVNHVVHKTFVKVDEEGTEAAAATAVVVGFASLSERNVIRINRPFLFFIHDNDNIFFIGAYRRP